MARFKCCTLDGDRNEQVWINLDLVKSIEPGMFEKGAKVNFLESAGEYVNVAQSPEEILALPVFDT